MPKRKNAPVEEDGTRPLANKRWESFCLYYVGEHRGNATASCVACGYKSKNADVTGPRLLGIVGIQRRIKHLEDELAESERLRAIDAVRRLKNIATITLADFYKDGRINPEKLEDPRLMQAVESVTPIFDKDGVVLDYRIKLLDPMQALDRLGLTEKKEEQVQNNQVLVIKV